MCICTIYSTLILEYSSDRGKLVLHHNVEALRLNYPQQKVLDQLLWVEGSNRLLSNGGPSTGISRREESSQEWVVWAWNAVLIYMSFTYPALLGFEPTNPKNCKVKHGFSFDLKGGW